MIDTPTPTRSGNSSPQFLTFLGVVLALLVLVGASIAIGSQTLAPAAVWKALLGIGDGGDRQIVWDLRVPRTLLGITAGAALGIAGILIQGFTRNPLADPGLLGVNAGAALSVAFGVVVFGVASSVGAIIFGMAGALIAAVAVLAVSRARQVDPARILLAGVAVSGVLTGITNGLMLVFPAAFDRMRGWSVGSFFLVSSALPLLAVVAVLVAIGAGLAFLLGSALDTLALGSDVAAALGVREGLVQGVGVLALTLMVGGVTALAGPIAFVGLMVPHFARQLARQGHRRQILAALLLGPLLVLAADVIGRLLIPGGEVPVGVTVAFVGAPTLLLIARRARELSR